MTVLRLSAFRVLRSRSALGLPRMASAACVRSLSMIPRNSLTGPVVPSKRSFTYELPENKKPQMSSSLLAVIRALASNIMSTVFKIIAYSMTQSSSMLAETLHGIADCINESLLFIGERQLTYKPNQTFQYGYGRSPFFWSLVSAMGTFWMGASVSIGHGIYSILYPAASLDVDMWTVSALAISFCLDGWVLTQTLLGLNETKPSDTSFWQHFRNQKNPTLLTVIFEDMAACLGVVIGASGMAASYATGNMVFDGLGSIGIGCLLAFVSLRLIYLNQNYLLGRAIDPKIEIEITGIIRSRRSIDFVKNVQTEWVSPATFSYSAIIDLDGTYLAAQLFDRYKPFFSEEKYRGDLAVFMAWFAEDLTRLVEQEVNSMKSEIRTYFPEALYLDLELGSNSSGLTNLSSKTDEEQKAIKNLTYLYQKYGTLDRVQLRMKINSMKRRDEKLYFPRNKFFGPNSSLQAIPSPISPATSPPPPLKITGSRSRTASSESDGLDTDHPPEDGSSVDEKQNKGNVP